MPQATASYLVVSALADAPLSLTDEEQEEFRRQSRELTKNALRIEAWLAFFLIPCFGVLDWVVLPDHFRTFMFLRLAGSVVDKFSEIFFNFWNVSGQDCRRN